MAPIIKPIHPMKTELQKALATLAPSVDVHTFWTRDHDEKFSDPINKDWTAGLSAKDWKCWQAEVRASIVKDGQLVSGSAYLVGTWEPTGARPAISNPSISGYELQMTTKALEELLKLAGPHPSRDQIQAAIAHTKGASKAAYEAQLETAWPASPSF